MNKLRRTKRVHLTVRQVPSRDGQLERKGTVRGEVLGLNPFSSHGEVREISHGRMIDCNEVRPHDSPGAMPPVEYPQQSESFAGQVSP